MGEKLPGDITSEPAYFSERFPGYELIYSYLKEVWAEEEAMASRRCFHAFPGCLGLVLGFICDNS